MYQMTPISPTSEFHRSIRKQEQFITCLIRPSLSIFLIGKWLWIKLRMVPLMCEIRTVTQIVGDSINVSAREASDVFMVIIFVSTCIFVDVPNDCFLFTSSFR